MSVSPLLSALPRNRLICEFSVWSADLVHLAEDLKRIAPYADILHVDVADGHFAPSMLFFPDLVAALRKVSDIPIHVHLMVHDDILVEQVRQFADAGSDIISIHVENTRSRDRALDLLDAREVAAGMVLRFDSDVETVVPYLSRLQFLTLLGTEIGVKGQDLSELATARLKQANSFIAGTGMTNRIVLAADGGIREHTVPLLRNAGAETVVLGSLAFGAEDLQQRIAWLHSL